MWLQFHIDCYRKFDDGAVRLEPPVCCCCRWHRWLGVPKLCDNPNSPIFPQSEIWLSGSESSDWIWGCVEVAGSSIPQERGPTTNFLLWKTFQRWALFRSGLTWCRRGTCSILRAWKHIPRASLMFSRYSSSLFLGYFCQSRRYQKGRIEKSWVDVVVRNEEPFRVERKGPGRGGATTRRFWEPKTAIHYNNQIVITDSQYRVYHYNDRRMILIFTSVATWKSDSEQHGQATFWSLAIQSTEVVFPNG